MKQLLLPILTACLLFSGCASLTPETKDKLGFTGSWLLGKATDIALSAVVSAATSPGDAGTKANWLDSLGAGLRTEATASFSGDDVRKLIGIWTPSKPHWQDLGAQLADAVIKAKLPPAKSAEILAQAANAAAARARNDSLFPLPSQP